MVPFEILVLVTPLTLVAGTPGVGARAGIDQPVQQATLAGRDPSALFGSERWVHQEKQLLVTVKSVEIGEVNFHAYGADWGQRQPKVGQWPNARRVPTDGGSLSLLVPNSEAEKLQTWLDSGARAALFCLSRSAGDYMWLKDAFLEAIRPRAAERSLVIVSAPSITSLSGERAKVCEPPAPQ